MIIDNDFSHLEQQFKIKFLDPSYFDKVKVLQDKIIEKQAKYIAPMDDELISKGLAQKSAFFVGVLDQEELVGTRLMNMPGMEGDNYGMDIIGFPAHELTQVIQLDSLLVNPKYRGAHLHHWMNFVAFEKVKKVANILHVCATVAPWNYPSIRQVFRNGLAIKWLKPKFSNTLRFICHRDLREPLKFPHGDVWVMNDQYDEIKDLCIKGYTSVRTKKSGIKGKDFYKIGFCAPTHKV